MGHYKSNLRDIEFNLFEVLGRDDVLGTGPFAEVDGETAREILAEVDRLAREDLAASFEESDRTPPVFDPETHTAPLPESFKKSYRAWMDAEYWRLATHADLGGTPAPSTMEWAVGEMVLGANPAIWMYGAGPMFAGVLNRNGNERDKKIARLIVDQRWVTTMVLTEPDAGSDVGAGRTKATPNDDGTWNIEGVKRFITSGESDLSDNVIHMVLARPQGVEGAGGPGTKGLSLFIVPKFHFDVETGELTGERNGVYVTGVEHKMGIKVSNTCELTFGDPGVGGGEPARGYLLGEVHNGIAQMFQVIENARMMVGTKAIATLSTGYLNALEFAKERVQGADLTQAARQDRAAGHDHPPPRRTPLADDAEVVRRGDARAGPLHRVLAGPGRDRRARTARRTSWRWRSTTCCCRSSRATARSARGSCWAPRRCRPSAARASCRTTRSSSTSATPRSTPSTRARPRSRARTSSSARSSRTRAARWATWPRRSRPSSRAKRATAGSRSSAACWPPRWRTPRPIVGHMIDDLMSADASAEGGDVRNIYKVGLNTSRLLMVLGDVVCAWLMLRGAQVALGKLAGEVSAKDQAFYEGKVAAAQFFAQTNLPRVSAERRIAEQIDLSLMDLDESAF